MNSKNTNVKDNKVKKISKTVTPDLELNIETAQDTIPIIGIHEKYDLIETYKGCFTKSYFIGDNNYLTAPEEDQEVLYKGYRKIINSFGSECEFSLTINNKNVNIQDFCDSVLLKETGDEYDYLRKQMNTIILNRMNEGKNGIVKEKYLNVAVHADTPQKAYEIFHRLDKDLDTSFKSINSSARPLTLEERLNILYEIYNDDKDPFISKQKQIDEVNGHVDNIYSFDYDNMRNMGLSINDLLAPSSIQIGTKNIRLGNKLARCLKVSQLPTRLADTFLTNVTSTDYNCITTINFKPLSPKETDQMIATNLTFVRGEKNDAMKRGQKQGIYDGSNINPELLDREDEILKLREDVHDRDEKLLETTITVIIFADNEKELDEYTTALITEYKKVSVEIGVLYNQQEECFNSTLPLCYNQIIEKRTLTSSVAAILIPFSTLEVNDDSGINYSCNLISKNLIVYDRMKSKNYNGFILGSPGSGKSFTAKTEMINVFLKTNSDIIIIDPEDEYGDLVKMLGGEVIKIVPGGDIHINPLDIENNYELEEQTNPVNAKADFILKLMECILNSPFGVDSIQQTIIDDCVHELYRPFIKNGKLIPIPPEQMPTLTDLQYIFSKRAEPEARQLSMALKLYSGNGSLNTFGFQTNVKTNNRFIVYQIRDIGDRLKPLAMLIILDHIWNKIVENRKTSGRNTWFYVDEIYLLFQQSYSASFLNTLFRRARKYGGVPTGITQNVAAMLENPDARDMLQNCCFIEILAQAGPDRNILQEILNLSNQQISYITNSPKGQGLLYTGANIIPFYSTFDKNTDLYRVMTSDFNEIKRYKQQEMRDKIRKEKEEKNLL